MSTGGPSGHAERSAGTDARGDRPVEQRAEEIVERVSSEAMRFARRLVARAREEVEDIVAEAQTIRRGDRHRDQPGA